ncbi:MAG: hypothetical protein IT349_19255 [Candidatus Eisenbacteria bacterium]|nr:hypothetical protein [Candidatus Eisenbacteria bacterium]
MAGANPPVGGTGPTGMVTNLVRQVGQSAPQSGGLTAADFGALNRMPGRSPPPAATSPGAPSPAPTVAGQMAEPSVIAQFLNPTGRYKGS